MKSIQSAPTALNVLKTGAITLPLTLLTAGLFHTHLPQLLKKEPLQPTQPVHVNAPAPPPGQGSPGDRSRGGASYIFRSTHSSDTLNTSTHPFLLQQSHFL